MAKDTWQNIKEKSSDVANTIKEKSAEAIDSVQKNPTVKDMKEAARKNPKEAILAILISLGFIFSFYWLGSLVVGLAAALYTPWTIREVWDKGVRFYEREGKFPSFMLAVALLFLLVHIFWFVIGGIIGLSIKLVFKKNIAQDASKK